MAKMVKNLPATQKTRVQVMGWEGLLEKEIATHSSILAWEIPWTEELGVLQSTGLQRVGHDWVHTHTHTHTESLLPWFRTINTCFQRKSNCSLKGWVDVVWSLWSMWHFKTSFSGNFHASHARPRKQNLWTQVYCNYASGHLKQTSEERCLFQLLLIEK